MDDRRTSAPAHGGSPDRIRDETAGPITDLGAWFGDIDIYLFDQCCESASRRLPDGSDRYLVDEALLMRLTRELGGELLDPLKTTIVQSQRCMTTWVARVLLQ